MISVTVMVIGESKETVKTITVEVPQQATIKDLCDFLKESRQIEFSNFILTNNPKEKVIIGPDRILKSVQPQCQRFEDKMVLLCYQTQLKPLPFQEEPRKPKKQSKGGCPCM